MLNEIGHDYDQLRAELFDSATKRQRDEELVRTRALEVASGLQRFWNARSPLGFQRNRRQLSAKAENGR